MTTTLWPVPVDFFPFQQVQSSLNCAPYNYYVNADPAIMGGLEINLRGQLAIKTRMTELSQLGTWPLSVSVCVVYGNGEEFCFESNTV